MGRRSSLGASGWRYRWGYPAFPAEILCPPRAVAETMHHITRWTEMPAGGHFAALEQPVALAEDVRAFFRELREAPAAS